jgi:hypothetical protein
MKRQVDPHACSGRHGIPSGSGQASVFAIPGRTGLRRGLVDGRNNHSDGPLDSFRSSLLALVIRRWTVALDQKAAAAVRSQAVGKLQ